MRTLFDGDWFVHYSQAYVLSRHDGSIPDFAKAFIGQSNGLCGGAGPGALFLVTGLHTGHVGLAVEFHEQPPPADSEWEDVVEVSFTPNSADVHLSTWAGEKTRSLGLSQGSYRVRYSGRAMDAARAADTVGSDQAPIDHYLLQFWPAPSAPDGVLRQTSEIATYWHQAHLR